MYVLGTPYTTYLPTYLPNYTTEYVGWKVMRKYHKASEDGMRGRATINKLRLTPIIAVSPSTYWPQSRRIPNFIYA
jgi:hypothetical protein